MDPPAIISHDYALGPISKIKHSYTGYIRCVLELNLDPNSQFRVLKKVKD